MRPRSQVFRYVPLAERALAGPRSWHFSRPLEGDDSPVPPGSSKGQPYDWQGTPGAPALSLAEPGVAGPPALPLAEPGVAGQPALPLAESGMAGQPALPMGRVPPAPGQPGRTSVKRLDTPGGVPVNTAQQRPGKAHEPVLVSDAGVVLLWPFLSQWLSQMQLIDDGQFVDQAAQLEGARRLGWLIGIDLSERERPPSLLLALCQLPLTLQLEPQDPPHEQTQALYEDWLREVIRPNRDLHRLGVELFGQWFVHREGRLLLDEVHFGLSVDASSVDVLLRRLEWRWDRVSLPWLPRTLSVDWVPFDRLW